MKSRKHRIIHSYVLNGSNKDTKRSEAGILNSKGPGYVSWNEEPLEITMQVYYVCLNISPDTKGL